MRIQRVQADHYFIPLPTVLSDSTHGTIRGFELLTVRLHDAEGAVGVGYTYTVGTGGAAVHALVARDLAPLLAGREAERIEEIGHRSGAPTTWPARSPRGRAHRGDLAGHVVGPPLRGPPPRGHRRDVRRRPCA